MSEMRLYLDDPNIGSTEKKFLEEAVDSGYVSTAGPFVEEFESKFADYLGMERAVSVQSGTSALHMILHELGIGPGDEVIVPALTFVATVNPVLYVGATPVFVDVEEDTWNMDPAEIERNITEKTKAVIPVHLYGNPCNMDEICAIARTRGIYVIEDATESLGAEYNRHLTGTLGDYGFFSFNGNKIITTGGGGMITGKDVERLEHIKFLVNQARDTSKGYYHPEMGFNLRMTNIEAALGLAQMEQLDGFLKKKHNFSGIYRKRLKGCRSVSLQKETSKGKSSCWLICACLDREGDVSFFQKELWEMGIPTRRVFMPATEFPYYRDFKRGDYKNSYRVYKQGLCFPASTLNSSRDIEKTADQIKERAVR